jgi:hypothetical protein
MAPAPVTPAPAKTVATNGAPVIPPPLPDTLGRYGKILMPGDDTSHPLKLKMPFPGVGEVKVPNQDEVNMRDKLEQLAKLSDADIRLQLDQWPAYGNMSLRDQGVMLQRIQDFRDYRARIAVQKAHDMGLLTLTPEQKVRFEKDYWDKRLQMDHDLAKQLEPIFRAREQKLQDELFREFSSGIQGPLAQAPRPPVPGPPPTNKPAQAPPPVAPIKAASSAPSAPATNVTQPMAQAPR